MKNIFVTRKLTFFCKKNLYLSALALCALFLVLNSCASKGNPPSKSTFDEKIGQILHIGFRGLQAGNESNIADIIRQYHIGGVVLFDYDVPSDSALRNIQSPEQLKTLTGQLQQHAGTPLLISIDQEGGMVNRLKKKYGFPATVSAQYLGGFNSTDSTRYYARKTAQTLSDAGINLNLAPVVDLNLNPDNPVIGSIERSYSANPNMVTRHASAYIETLHEHDILTALKHFPGHGSSKKDSHKGVVDVTDTWRPIELQPYTKLINNGYNDIVMTAHIYNARLDSTYPATLSHRVISGMLRDSLDYDGVVMSDDLQMGAIRKEYGLKETIHRALDSGVDILVFANNSVFDPDIAAKAHRIINELVEEGEISEERITESYNRIIQLKERL